MTCFFQLGDLEASSQQSVVLCLSWHHSHQTEQDAHISQVCLQTGEHPEPSPVLRGPAHQALVIFESILPTHPPPPTSDLNYELCVVSCYIAVYSV